MWNAEWDELQAGIKLAGRDSNNLSFADGIILMAESEEELEPLDAGEGEWKSQLKTE